ncbi:MAG TPA: DUF998 domain-containing protein [Vicinamibacterales bacterium]|nr:DUF998 domain-containing protein [Vicinamibacterales bacterium]
MRLPDIPTHALGVAGIGGPVIFTVLVIVQGVLQPDYSHVQMPISALAAWPLGWVQELNFAVLGVSQIAFALGLHRAVRPGKSANQGGAGAALIAMGGVGVLVAGAFSWKMVGGVPTETPPHVVGAITAFASTGLGFMRISNRLAADAAWKDLALYTRVTGGAVLVLFLALGFLAVDPGTPLNPWAGLLQRVLCLVWFSCVIVLSRRVMHR